MDIKIKNKNTNILAYIGDGVYELFVREKIVTQEYKGINEINKRVIAYVSSQGQSMAAKELQNGFLTEEEKNLLKRARNKRSMSRPKNADPKKYKLATAFEALIGALYLEGNYERAETIMEKAMQIVEGEINE